MWAFGCVLYEMLTGKRPFAGEDVAETFVSVLSTEPDWDAFPSETPLPIRRLLERCLHKDRKRRLAAIADARWHIDEASQPAERPRSPARLAWIAAGASTIAAVALIAYMFRGPTEVVTPNPAVQFTIDAPDDVSFGGLRSPGSGVAAQLAISPDGQQVVFVGTRDGASQLWLRPLGSLTSTPLAGTEGAAFPFWSPDSRVVAFFAGEKLKKVTLEGGSPIVLCDVIAGRGGSWSRDNVIIFASLRTDGLRRVSSAGGAPVAVTSLAFWGRRPSLALLLARRSPLSLHGDIGALLSSRTAIRRQDCVLGRERIDTDAHTDGIGRRLCRGSCVLWPRRDGIRAAV